MAEKLRGFLGGGRSTAKDTSTTATATPAPAQVEEPHSNQVRLDQDIEDVDHQLEPLPAGFDLQTKHQDFKYFIPPESPVYHQPSVFLAGSIEMGKAIQWQERLRLFLKHLPLTVCNPRRGSWDDATTEEGRKAKLAEQIKWELDALNEVDVICFFFDHNTISPVTLMELGLWASSGKVVVCCDRDYWRADNVHAVCRKYGVPFTDSFKNLIPLLKHKLQEKGMEFDPTEDVRVPPQIADTSVVVKPTQWAHSITKKATKERVAPK